MNDTKTLIQRVATAISTAEQGETYEECRMNEANATIQEIASWIEETFNSSFITAYELRSEGKKYNSNREKLS